MKFRSTWIFAGVVAALMAYSIYEFNNFEDSNRPGEEDIFTFKIDQVEQISLNGPHGKVVVKRNGKVWQMMEPVKDLADEVAMESLLLTVLGEKARKFSEEKSKDWAEYGLAPPKLTVELDSVDRTEHLEVSSTNAFDGSFYLRWKDQLLLGDRMWARVIDQKPNTLRDRRILPPNTEDVTFVEVQVDTQDYKGRYSFKKSEDGWKMSPDPGFPVEPVKVDHWLDEVQRLRANDFVLERMNSPEQFQLNRPSLKIAIHMGEKVWNLRFSPDHGDEVHVKTSLKDCVYTLGQGLMRTIRVGPRFFRDGKLPFRFDLEKASQVDAIQDGKSYQFSKGDTDWKLLGEGELNQPRLVEFMQKLKSLEAVDFPSQGKGFESPKQKVKVVDHSGAVLLEFIVGGQYKAADGMNKGVPLNFVRVAGQKQILGVKSQQLNSLLAPDIVKGKSENH